MENSPKPTYLIGDFEFVPSRFLLIDHRPEKGCQEKDLPDKSGQEKDLPHKSGQEKKLELKQSKILELFVQHQGEIVARDMLEQAVWAGTIVSEQAVNNKISELRKLFGDNYKTPKYLKTHPKLGYELIADCCRKEASSGGANVTANEELPAAELASEGAEGVAINPRVVAESEPMDSSQVNTPADPANTQKRASYSYNLILVFLIVVSCVLLGYLYFENLQEHQITPKYSAHLAKPVTTDKGQEWAINVSNSGRYIAYSHRLLTDKHWRIRVKDTETGEAKYLTPRDYDSQSAVWHPNESRLYFVKFENNRCTIWQVDNVWQTPVFRQFADCGGAQTLAPLSIDARGNWLYYTLINESYINIVVRYNLVSGVMEQLTAPPTTNYGDYAAAIASNGRKLAFLRTYSPLDTDLMVLHLDSREIVKLASFTHNISEITWSADDQQILYVDSHNRLISMSLNGDKTELTGANPKQLMAPYSDKQGNVYFIDGFFHISDVYQLNNKGDLSQLVSSSYQDFSAAQTPTNKALVYTSDKSGYPQIWLKKGATEQAITKYTQPTYLPDKIFNGAGDTIYFIEDDQVKSIDLATYKVTSVLPNYNKVASIDLSCDKELLLFVALDDGAWHLYSHSLSAKITKKLLTSVSEISIDCANHKYYATPVEAFNVIEFSLSGEVINENIFDSEGYLFWHIYKNTFYGLTESTFELIDLSGEVEKQTITFGQLAVYHFEVDQNGIVFSGKHLAETSVKAININ